ncbi:uncharacterized protein I303_108243 [Kwoniella dejecticola CBS 10117]|uniref:Uncharacterized protein n=1 Tax=Kwoniella dejecticola CBS 10117 TaxID=1296121 RepID=A0A1A5ZXX5_9TREE|nr:uncharacterized protein I303_07430 [Kwoniella dejecticola CBS 10117]OBR82667.1 hypothetical protein I303_07430 [Kwoniella dejecticola CBS 10117]
METPAQNRPLPRVASDLVQDPSLTLGPIVMHPWFSPILKSGEYITLLSTDQIGYVLISGTAKSIGINTRSAFKSDTPSAIIRWDASSDSITLILTTLLQPHRFLQSQSHSHLRPQPSESESVRTDTNPNSNPKFSSTAISLLKLLPEALAVSQTYKIPKFFLKFTSLLLQLHASPLILYTAYALARDTPNCKRYSSETLTEAHLGCIPKPLRRILQTHCPRYLIALDELHLKWVEAYEELQYCFTKNLKVNIKLEGYGSICKKRFGRGCPAYISTNHSFTRLRQIAGEAALTVIKSNAYRFMCAEIEEAIHEATRCETCAHRLINAFDAVMRHVMSDLRTTIAL